MTQAFRDAFARCPLVAILRGVRPDEVEDIGIALVEAGFTRIEVPLNSPDPFDSIAVLNSRLGDRALIGAGTVLTPDDVARVAAAGAHPFSEATAQEITGKEGELDEIAVLMRRAVDAGEHRAYSDLNQRLHALVRGIAGHGTADRIVETLRGQLVRHQFMLSLLPGRPQTSLPQHERIIAAIRDRDPKAAENAMREHIASVIEALRSIDYLGGPA